MPLIPNCEVWCVEYLQDALVPTAYRSIALLESAWLFGFRICHRPGLEGELEA